MTAALPAALLAEIADVLLAGYGHITCAPTVDLDDGAVVLTVRVAATAEHPARVLSLYDDLKYVCDMATMRALCVAHDLDPQWLEKALRAKEDASG